MSYCCVYRQCFKFQVLWSNVQDRHDFQKVCLETTLCVYACCFEFYVFVLDEIDVVDPNIVC